MAAYYNEIEPFAAQWLRNLIAKGIIADGEVDERSIVDVTPNELRGFTQCHFFAGIGVWSYALRQSGWGDDRPVWTGSCPCQPFSSAGKRKGIDDKRHLFPHFHHLIKECRPVTVFGEQVANKAGESWFDLVSADLAGEGYTAGMSVFPACGIGAPHQRKRLYWVAEDTVGNSDRQRQDGVNILLQRKEQGRVKKDSIEATGSSEAIYVGNTQRGRANELAHTAVHGHATANGLREEVESSKQTRKKLIGQPTRSSDDSHPQATNGMWRNADWLYCRDDKWRSVEPGTFPLANGATKRVGRLRGYGNAIVAPQAQSFIEAYMSI